MDKNLNQIKTEVYEKCKLEIEDFETEPEGKQYDACRFTLNGRTIISRSARITPKKIGQFVTFWKRNGNGPIAPFDETDRIDFYVVNVRTENEFGQFVFPKSVLLKKGIITTEKKKEKGLSVCIPLGRYLKINKRNKRKNGNLIIFMKSTIHRTAIKLLCCMQRNSYTAHNPTQ